MRKSRVLRETRAGELAACLKINITHPAIIELAGLANRRAFQPQQGERREAEHRQRDQHLE